MTKKMSGEPVMLSASRQPFSHRPRHSEGERRVAFVEWIVKGASPKVGGTEVS
jgi:hypothetical protein